MNNSSHWRADALLLLAAVIWGLSFVAQRLGADVLGPFSFNAARFGLGALCLGLWVARRNGTSALLQLDRSFAIAAGMGLVLMLGSAFQQAGLAYTTAGKAAFVTSLYIIGVPLLGIFVGQRAGRWTWAGAAIALVGLYFLSIKENFTIAYGDGLELLGAVCWSAHVLLTGHFARKLDVLQLAYNQFLMVAVYSAAMALVFETATPQQFIEASGALLFTGVLSTALAFTLQLFAQRDAPAAHAALILSMEMVFAAIGGWLWLNEVLTSRDLLGCGLMLTGILLSQATVLSSRRAQLA